MIEVTESKEENLARKRTEKNFSIEAGRESVSTIDEASTASHQAPDDPGTQPNGYNTSLPCHKTASRQLTILKASNPALSSFIPSAHEAQATPPRIPEGVYHFRRSLHQIPLPDPQLIPVFESRQEGDVDAAWAAAAAGSSRDGCPLAVDRLAFIATGISRNHRTFGWCERRHHDMASLCFQCVLLLCSHGVPRPHAINLARLLSQSCPGIVSEHNENHYMALCDYTGINLQLSIEAAHFSVEGIYRYGSLRDKLLYHCPVNVRVVAADVNIARLHYPIVMLPLIAAYLRTSDTTDADEREGQEVKKRKEEFTHGRIQSELSSTEKNFLHLDLLDVEVPEDDVEEGRVSSTSVRKEVVSPIPRNLAFGW